MVFYEIEILSVPQIRFAYNVEIEKYKNSFKRIENFLEIALCLDGRILFEYENGEKEITKPRMLLPMIRNVACTTAAYENEKQRHVTVGMNLSYKWKRHCSTDECNIAELRGKVEKHKAVLIPYHCDMGEYYDEVKSLLRKIISENASENEGRKLAAVGYCYALLGVLSDFVLKRLADREADFSPSEGLYAERAAEYINKNYAKKITVRDISDFLGISEGYLHRIFKNVKKCTVVEYINKCRIFAAAELMESKALSLKEAAYNVGIEDTCYMSRLFRKVMGVSYREYIKKY